VGVLILVRHGRTGFNAAGRLVGRLDPPLDEVGLIQAAAIGEALKGVDRIISSPLQRARETAEYIGSPVEVDERWIEVDYGAYDGVELGAPATTELWERWRVDTAFVPPGGESLVQMGERVAEAMQELVKDAGDTDIAVVSHVSPIKAAVSWVLHADAETAWRSHLDQASISRIAVTPRGAVLRSFNETWHLR
jgi:broad specificity phosphatase PhoE